MPLLLPPLKTVDRYILREWLKVFGISIAVTMGLLVLNDMYSNFGDLMDYQAGLRQILLYYLVLIPGFLPIVLPIALLLSLLFCLGNLHRNNEFVALRASGMSIGRITVTIWICGALLSILLLGLNARVVPWSVEQSRRMRDGIEFSYLAEARGTEDVGLIRTLAFDNRSENRIWFMNRFSQFTYRAFGVSVFQLNEERREVERVMAREAYFDDYWQQWVFIDGRRMIFDPETGESMESPQFEQYMNDTFNETPETMLLFNKKSRDLSLHEIGMMLDLLGEDHPKANGLQVQYHTVMAGAFSCLIIVGLAIPFATTGVRVNPMVGISKSLGLFAAYYVLENIARIVGERGALAPMVAAWMPVFVMGLVAIWFFRRVK